MLAIFGLIFKIIGGLGLYTFSFVWIIHFIYKLAMTDVGFFSALFVSVIGLVLQVVVSLAMVEIGKALSDKSSGAHKNPTGYLGPGGGLVFYDKGEYFDGWRYLEAAPIDQGQTEWGCIGMRIGGLCMLIGDGKYNTEVIAEACQKDGIAARVAREYRGGGKDDWFLPSINELEMMYKNLHLKGIGGFADNDSYWSSSESDAYDAWFQNFSNGTQYAYSKYSYGRVRAVRAF